jgi:uncharacterized repeat protein (TIGR01451 family)
VKKVKIINLLLTFLLLVFTGVLAEEKGLDIKMYGYLISFEKKGNEFTVKRNPLPENVKPEDIIEYQIVVKNPTKKSFYNVFIKAPIPKGTKYIENSSTDGAMFSIDGGKTYKNPPVKYKVKENGKEVEKIATPDMYTNIGWNIKEIKPDETKKFIYWVKVEK